jgi:tetratricopeptide (TPR) repeat protein
MIKNIVIFMLALSLLIFFFTTSLQSSQSECSYANSLAAEIGQTEDDFNKTLRVFESAVNREPKNSDLQSALGLQYLSGCMYDKSIDVFKQCIEIDKTDFLCYWYLFETQLISEKGIDAMFLKQLEKEVINSEEFDGVFVQMHVDILLLFEKVLKSGDFLALEDKTNFERKYAGFLSQNEYFTEHYFSDIEHWIINKEDNQHLLDTLSFFKSFE